MTHEQINNDAPGPRVLSRPARIHTQGQAPGTPIACPDAPCPCNQLVSSEHPCPYLAQCFRMYPSPACITPSAAVGYGCITRATTSSPTPACIASVTSLIMSPALAATTVAPTMAPVPCLQWISTNPPSWLCGDQWQPVAMSGHQWPSVAISGHQWQSSDLPFEDDSIVMLQRRHIGVNGDAARRRLGLRQPDSGQLRLGVATSRHIRHEPGHLPRVGQSVAQWQSVAIKHVHHELGHLPRVAEEQSVAISGNQWQSVSISVNQCQSVAGIGPALRG